MKPERDAGAVRLAQRVFGSFLRLLPAELRADFGAEMSADFAGLARDAHGRHGFPGVLVVLLRSTLDLLLRSSSEHWQPDPYYLSERGKLPLGERMSLLRQELRLAVRALMKRPGFTLVAVLTLALGIGANVAIFAVVNAVLIRPLPYAESERIIRIFHHAPGLQLPDLENSPGTMKLYQQARSFEHLAGYSRIARNMVGSQQPARVSVLSMTPSLFDVLQVKPAMGRRFVAEDAHFDSPPRVAILTYTGWRTHFAGAQDVIGKKISLNGWPIEIVGVMPKGFAFPDADTELLTPEAINPDGAFGEFGLGGIARLKTGVSLERARAEVAQLQPRLTDLFPRVTPQWLKNAGWSSSVETLRDNTVQDAETALWIVLGTVGFLLLVACASVANLFLVRAESRQRETGIRFALGATHARVAATFISESLLLGVAGGAWGLLLAYAAVRAIVAAAPAQLPRLNELNLDFTVVLFAAVISIVAGLIFGILPLPTQMRRSMQGLARAGRGNTEGRERHRLRKTLIVTQIALAVVLVTGSGLMLRSFQRLRAVDPGVRTDGVLTLGVSLGEDQDKAKAAAIYQRMVDELRLLPGVVRAGATNSLPLDPDGLNGSSFRIESRPRDETQLPPVSMYAVVTEDYFPAIGTPILRGRGIERGDHEHNRAVVVVSHTFERELMGGKALGERIAFGTDSTWLEIVGVVGDVRTFGLREDIRPMAYLPMTTSNNSARIGLMNLVVRSHGDPVSLVAAARSKVQRIDPNTPITSVRTLNDVRNESIADTSFTTTILLIAAIVALLLGAIGLYGVIGYVVSQRTQEMGVRIALGAIPAQVRAMVLRQGVVLAGIGVAIGLGAAVALTRLMQAILYETDTRDPLTFAIVPAVMLAVSVVAAYVPARRASSVSPLQAIRSE
jgi:predicted permease